MPQSDFPSLTPRRFSPSPRPGLVAENSKAFPALLLQQAASSNHR